MFMKNSSIEGFVKPGFEAVREAFVENFNLRNELGAACCIYRHGEKVVDMWGGIRNADTGKPWEEDTMVFVASTTKGLSGMAIPFDKDSMPVRNLEVPSQGGVGNARAIAHAYSVFATGGRELGLRPETLRALMAPAVPPKLGFYDECMKREWQLSLGFAKPDAGFPFGSPAAFGTPGSGGSIGFADPQTGIGYTYVLNRLGSKQGTDSRELALRQAMFRSNGMLDPLKIPTASQTIGQVEIFLKK